MIGLIGVDSIHWIDWIDWVGVDWVGVGWIDWIGLFGLGWLECAMRDEESVLFGRLDAGCPASSGRGCHVCVQRGPCFFCLVLLCE